MAPHNFGSCADVDEAEMLSSSMMAMFDRRPPGKEPALDAGRVLAAARRHPDRTAAAEVAAVLAAYGPPGQRQPARSLVARLIDRGTPVPEWIGALGDVEPRRAVVIADGWDEERVLWIDFQRPDGEIRGIGMQVNALNAGYACGFLYGPAVEEICGAVEDGCFAMAREISLADARAMAAWGLAVRDICRGGYSHPDEDLDEGAGTDTAVDEEDEELRALVDQRVALLPEGGAVPFDGPLTEDEFDHLCDEFRASRWLSVPDPYEPPNAGAQPDAEEIDALCHWLVNNVCEFAEAWCDADPLRWSPVRVHGYLQEWVPEMVPCHEMLHYGLEWAFPRWLRFVGERRGLDEDLMEENVAAARASFSVMRANSADPSKRSALTNILTELVAGGVDVRDEAEVQSRIDGHIAVPRQEQLMVG
jgi:hypothetical protein